VIGAGYHKQVVVPQTPVWTVLVLAGLTAFIAFVLARTAFALARHTFLPRPAVR
jgi:hypothetical protein